MSLIFADPTKDPKLAKHILDKFETDQIKLYNFGSIMDIGIRIDKLYPQPNIMAILKAADFGNGDAETSIQFDIAYMSQILNNEECFTQFMQFMTESQDDKDVYVLCNYNEPTFEPVIESMIKMIQERYSVNAYTACIMEDIEGIEGNPIDFLTKEGNINFIEDCSKYAKILGTPIITAKQREDEMENIRLDQEALEENRRDDIDEQVSKQV